VGERNLRGIELEVTAHRHRDPSVKHYAKVSDFVSNEVLGSGEAILPRRGPRPLLAQPQSLSDMGATSLICAPIIHGGRCYGLIHLYCTDPHRALDAEDLEFTVAVAKQTGTAISNLQKQDQLSAENRSLRDQLKVESELVGDSGVMKHVEAQIGKVAGTTATVLVRGESGSGKELVARDPHSARGLFRLSPSTAPPFPKRCSKARSSGTRRGRSPARRIGARGASSWPIAARCSWTRLAR
jgi:Nif-specific regulatory protein